MPVDTWRGSRQDQSEPVIGISSLSNRLEEECPQEPGSQGAAAVDQSLMG